MSEENKPDPAVDAPEQDDDTLKVDVSVEDAGTLKKKVTVTVSREQIDAKFDDMYGELSRSAQVPGFRIGHAPRRLLEKRFGKDVGDDVRNSLIGDSIGQAIEQADLKTLGEPDLKLDEIELPESGDLEYSFDVEVAPEFDLPELKGIKVEKPLMEVTDDRVDEYVDRLAQSKATYDDTDAPAAAGDMVTVDASITGDGLDTVDRTGLTLRVGPGQVEGLALVDLGDSITGKKAGDSVELTTKAPPAHPNEQWQDKDLTVKLTIGNVQGRQLPELTDEFATDFGFDGMDDMREFFAGEMGRRLEGDIRQAMRNQVCQNLVESTEFDLPEGVAARHTERAMQRRYVELLQQGVPREQIEENLTKLQADVATQAQRELKLTFVLGKIIEAESIEVSEDEINARVAQMAQAYNRRPERLYQELSQDGSIQQVAIALAEEKALDKLLDDADVTEVTPEQAAKKAEADAEGEAKPAKKTAKKAAKKKTAKKADADDAAEKKTAKKAAKKTAAKKTAKKTAKKAAKKTDKK